MKRIVSVIARDAHGALAVIKDRAAIACDDEHGGIAALVEKLKAEGHAAVLLLHEDDSLARHWTRPVETPIDPATDAARVQAQNTRRPRKRQTQVKKKIKR